MNQPQDKLTMEELRAELGGDETCLAFLEAKGKFTFNIEKEDVEKGKSFSASGMQEVSLHISNFMQTQVYKKWMLSGEPPTAMAITVTVDIH